MCENNTPCEQWKTLERNRDNLWDALNEIKLITESLTEFNPTYEHIYNIACNGLGEAK